VQRRAGVLDRGFDGLLGGVMDRDWPVDRRTAVRDQAIGKDHAPGAHPLLLLLLLLLLELVGEGQDQGLALENFSLLEGDLRDGGIPIMLPRCGDQPPRRSGEAKSISAAEEPRPPDDDQSASVFDPAVEELVVDGSCEEPRQDAVR
jgi:hypothetical protein